MRPTLEEMRRAEEIREMTKAREKKRMLREIHLVVAAVASAVLLAAGLKIYFSNPEHRDDDGVSTDGIGGVPPPPPDEILQREPELCNPLHHPALNEPAYREWRKACGLPPPSAPSGEGKCRNGDIECLDRKYEEEMRRHRFDKTPTRKLDPTPRRTTPPARGKTGKSMPV